MSSTTGRSCVRILAYLEIRYGAADYSGFPFGPIPSDHGLPAVFKGYSCDVTLEVESIFHGRSHVKIVDHYGDGILRQTLEEAQQFVLETTGIFPEAIPERVGLLPPETGEWGMVVAQFVQEYGPTNKPQGDVESESFIKSIGRGPREVEIGAPITKYKQ